MAGDWVNKQAAGFLSLQGQLVASWQSVEMAVRGGDSGTPAEFDGPDVPACSFSYSKSL